MLKPVNPEALAHLVARLERRQTVLLDALCPMPLTTLEVVARLPGAPARCTQASVVGRLRALAAKGLVDLDQSTGPARWSLTYLGAQVAQLCREKFGEPVPSS